MRSLREVRDSLLAREKKRIAVAAAEDRPVLEAVKEAVQMGIAEATLCGDEAKIRQIAEEIELDVNKVTIVNEPDIRKSAEAAVKLVHNGEAQLVMKGLIGTADFLRAVLNKEWGLRTGKILSHVAVFDSVKLDRLILMTGRKDRHDQQYHSCMPGTGDRRSKGSSCVCSRGIKSFHAAYTGCSFPGHHEPERPV